MPSLVMPNSAETRTDEAESALGVVDLDGMAVLRAETILEDEGGDAVVVEPVRDVGTLLLHGEVAGSCRRAQRGRPCGWCSLWAGR